MMDKLRWGSSGGENGPFTVDSGGGESGIASGSKKGPDRPPSKSSFRHSKPSTPIVSPSSSRPVFTQPPNPPQPYHTTGGGHSHEGSRTFNADLSFMATTPTPLIPTDPSTGLRLSAGRHTMNQMGQPSGYVAQHGQVRQSRPTQRISTTPIDPPPSPWNPRVGPAVESPFDWSHPQSGLHWGPQQTEDFNGSIATNEGMDPALFSSLAALVEESQSKAHNGREDFNIMHAMEATNAPMSATAASLSSGSSLLTRQLQQQQGSHANSYENLSGLYNSALHSVPPSPNSFLADPAPIGVLPTPPQSFSSATSKPSGRQSANLPGPVHQWRLPDTVAACMETPVTTPGDSEHGNNASTEVVLIPKPTPSLIKSLRCLVVPLDLRHTFRHAGRHLSLPYLNIGELLPRRRARLTRR